MESRENSLQERDTANQADQPFEPPALSLIGTVTELTLKVGPFPDAGTGPAVGSFPN
jgi:hypothetical protein